MCVHIIPQNKLIRDFNVARRRSVDLRAASRVHCLAGFHGSFQPKKPDQSGDIHTVEEVKTSSIVSDRRVNIVEIITKTFAGMPRKTAADNRPNRAICDTKPIMYFGSIFLNILCTNYRFCIIRVIIDHNFIIKMGSLLIILYKSRRYKRECGNVA